MEMRYSRHSKILELVKTQQIDTQQRLAAKLKASGFDVTQATISRDIKELGLIKVPGKYGRSVYAVSSRNDNSDSERFRKILRETVVEINTAVNIIVIHTLSGCAGAAAEVIDNLGFEGIVGTLAGDNTIFIAVDSVENVPVVKKLFEESMAE